MAKNIQTHNAKVDLVRKFLDYTNVTDASYALLEYTNEGYEIDRNKNDFGDGQKLGSTYFNKDTNTEQNSTYARAIEARFNEDRTGDWCIPFANKCLTEKDKISNNDITQVKLDSKLSKRTITFTNRFRILAHQENTSSGFSATLFEDTEDNNQKIFAIRGTEFPSGFSNDVLDSDANLALSSLPSNQYIDMIKFYTQCIADKYIAESTPLIITGAFTRWSISSNAYIKSL
ncbi:hypothetical protein [Helicobacter trogontum]|uniref:hypothetical protein n=2 Tax=Helicobacter trogontum TaxID=50960 RepID=UPI001F223207|nr:hypothetical protein [Helicobacter trogontum]